MMKNFTKLMLTAILLVAGMGGVNSVKARTNVDMSTATASTNATWNSETNTFSWTANDAYIVIPGLSGDLTGCYLNFTKGNAVDSRIDIVYTDNSVTTGALGGLGMFDASTGAKTQNLEAMAGTKITNVKEVRFCSATASGSLELTDISYYYPVIPKFNANGVATINLKSLVASGGLSFDPKTGVVTCNGTQGNLSLEFLDGVNLTGLKRYDVSISGSDAIVWRSIIKSQGTDVVALYGSKWGRDLTGEERAKALSVNEFFWESQSTEYIANIEESNRTFTITSITLTADKMNVVNAHDIPIATLPHYAVAGDGTVSQTTAISTNYGNEVEIPLGDGSSKMDEYIDIADYDELRIYTSDNARVFFINVAAITKGTSGTDGAIAKLDNSESGQVTFNHNTSEGYYYANVSDIKNTYNGQAKIIGVKGASWGEKLTVSKIQVYKENPTYDFILSGQYSSATDVSAVTSSTTATAIDCSSLSGNNATITAGNPNCLFVAKSGVLANTNNVIVGTTCNSLVLTDDYPFKAPSDFTATSASYSTTINTDAQAGTLCLPFAATIPEESVTAYTLAYASGDEATATLVETTIPANTPVLLNGSGSQTFTGSSVAITAGAPKTSEAMTGVYESTTVPQNSFVLQKQDDNVGFYKVASNDITISPFRAYMTAQNQGARIKIVYPGEITAVKKIAATKSKAGVLYNLNGQRISKTAKGLYLMNGKKYVK